MIVIFSGEYFETIGVKNLLSSFGIESYIENEYMSSIKPSLLNAGGYNPVSLRVNENDFDDANRIINEYNNGVFNIDS